MRKLRSFNSKIKNTELGVFDVLEHHIDILDILAQRAIAKDSKEDLLELADRYLDANDRYMTVIMGAEEEPVIESEPKQTKTGFEFPVETSDTPNGELG